jgi:nucleolar protein 56
MGDYILFESASGYGLFERLSSEQIGEQVDSMQQSFQDFGKFNSFVKLKAFLPFSSAENALENVNDISEGILHPSLKDFLEMNLSKDKKKKAVLGVGEDKIGSAIQDELKIKCEKSQSTIETLRLIRLHFDKFIKEMKSGDLEKSQLGLAHSYSRAKVKFNIHKVDNMIIQSIALLDQLDKDLNTFAMRCREWYSWHFPELGRIISDHATFARLVKAIKNKDSLSDESLPELTQITGDEDKAKEVYDAAKISMGTDISEIDMINIEHFADRIVELSAYRTHLHDYLVKKMNDVAPNLTALIGEQVGARLISHSGSLTNLAKHPASTIQILGAEKALFRALKTKGKTPKYGLIYHSSFIGKANTKNKGRISRYLANKCTIASRIDAFGESHSNAFGQALHQQVEDRLKFYESGETPRKNIDVMKEAIEEATRDGLTIESKKRSADSNGSEQKKKKKKKNKKEAQPEPEAMEEDQPAEEPVVEKREKKKKKKQQVEEAQPEPVEEEEPVVEKREKKKKKKSKQQQ